ncbi:MAG: purine-cytosine permease family protein [Leptospirales bacterium]
MSFWHSSRTAILPISPSERNYGFWDLFWNWFGDGSNASSWYFGGLLALAGLTFLFQNAFLWTPLIIIPWATLAYIAYRYGATTVVLARPVLGTLGASVFLGLSEMIVQIGWTTVTTYIGAASLVQIWHFAHGSPAPGGSSREPLVLAILLIAILQGVAATLGHVSIKILKWVASLLLLGFGGVETWKILSEWDLQQILSYRATASPLTISQLVDISFINVWTWLQVGDFARFSRSGKVAVMGSWLGLWAGQTWFVMVGALGVIGLGLASGHLDANDGDPSRLMARLGLSYVALSVILLSSISVSASNLYGAGMAFWAFLTRKGRPASSSRALLAVSSTQIFTAFIPLFFHTFLGYFTTFLTVIGGVFIPLWSLVLVDYLFLRKGVLDPEGLFGFTPGTAYWFRGGFNLTGLASLGAGTAFYYGLSHFFPVWSAWTGVAIPTIFLTGLVYVFLVRTVMGDGGYFPRG